VSPKTLDLRVAAALLTHDPLTTDGLRALVGAKYTDGELRASMIRLGAFHVWDTPDGEPAFTMAA
jgi:hypothetical protein